MFSVQLKEKYDVLVVGAGPGGLCAALKLRELNPDLSIALLDKRDPWREPVACAEAVHKGGLYELVQVDSHWIRGPVDGVVFVAPDGTRIKYKQKDSGVILDRAAMHRGLAERCAKQKIDCHFRANVKEIGALQDNYRMAKVLVEQVEHTIQAKVVIDASGAGPYLDQEPSLPREHFDVEPAVFALVQGIPCEPNYIELYFGTNYAPGGYAWVFPRDESASNVGVVVSREHVRNHAPRKMLKQFLADYAPEATPIVHHGGPIANGQDRRPIAANALFRVGDAADMVNPISRGGILEAMKAGQLAAQGTVDLLAQSQSPEQIYARYAQDWNLYKGNGHMRLAKAKNAFGNIPDQTLNRAAHKLAKIPEDKRTMFRIFWATMTSSPSLLWKMRSLF